jgi:hypothetical protein
MRTFLDNVRLALRGLRKEPRFTIVAALTLALGIGSVTAIFSVVNGVLLKPLPYRDAGRLANVWSNADGLSLNQFGLSPDLFVFFQRDTKSFENMAVFRTRDASLNDDANPEVVPAVEASASYFPTLGLAPRTGQLFDWTHDQRGASLVIVISDRLWHRRFGADRAISGRTVRVDGETATILGVLPPELDENGSPDVWQPTRFDWANPPTGTFGWNVTARLKPGVALMTAEAEFVPLVKQLTDGGIEAPDYRAFLTNGRYRVMVHSVREDIVGDLRQPLWILLGTVGFVLLIAVRQCRESVSDSRGGAAERRGRARGPRRHARRARGQATGRGARPRHHGRRPGPDAGGRRRTGADSSGPAGNPAPVCRHDRSAGRARRDRGDESSPR